MDKDKPIGALWVKQSGRGGSYMTGTIELNGRDGEKINIVCFKNDQKKSEKHPDWRILISKPRESTTARIDETERNQSELNNLPRKDEPSDPDTSDDINPEDIPF